MTKGWTRFYAAPIVTLLLCLFVMPAEAAAISQTRSPATAVNIPVTGDAWTSPAAVIGSDNARATALDSVAGGGTDCLALSGFGFVIPLTSVIDGIEVTIEGFSGGTAGSPGFISFLAKIVGTRSGFGSSSAGVGISAPVGPPDVISVDGSPTDLWSQTWTLAEINSPTFGVDIFAVDRAALASDTYSIDDVRITVYFTAILPATRPLHRYTIFLTLLALGVLIIWKWPNAIRPSP